METGQRKLKHLKRKPVSEKEKSGTVVKVMKDRNKTKIEADL